MAGEIFASIVHLLFSWPRLLGWAVFGVLALAAGGSIFYHARLWRTLRTHGWTVEHRGRDRIAYREMVRGRLEDFEIDGEMLVGTPHHVVYVPSAEKWERTSPPWARGRREEIVARIRSRLREPGYEYQYG